MVKKVATQGVGIARNIALLYALIGSGWILFSDSLVWLLTADAHTLLWLQFVKGGFFILFTALCLYGLIRYYINALLQSEAEHLRLTAILDATTDFISTASPQGQLLYMNNAVRRALGIGLTADITQLVIPVFHPAWASALIEQEGMPTAIRTGVWSGETAMLTVDGREVPLSQVILAHKNPDGTLAYFSTVARDISERKRAEREIRTRARQQAAIAELGIRALSGCSIGELLTEAAGLVARTLEVEYSRVLEVLPDGELVLRAGIGWQAGSLGLHLPGGADTLVGCIINATEPVLITDLPAEARFVPEPFLLEHGVSSGLGALIHGRARRYGTLGAYSRSSRQFSRDDIDFLQAIANVLAVAIQRAEAEAQLSHLATHDALTGLPNRVLLRDRLHLALAQARRDRQQVALLFLDLDGFKTVNDTLGHQAGDELLQVVAERIRACLLRASDTVARLGGDEFMLILPAVASPQCAAQVAATLLTTLAQPLAIRGQALFTSVSIGISLFPADATEPDELIRLADTAMYRAKERGRNNYQFFTTELNAAVQERLWLENGLRLALAQNEFEVRYQPKLTLSNGQIIGVEALLQWRHPLLGVVSPNRFIPVAEDTGLIMPIGEWVLRTACGQLKRWHEAGYPLTMAVNLSVRQLHQPQIVDVIEHILHETGAPGAYLELEITETDVMRDAEAAIVVMSRLKAYGIRFLIDDFGTGYSSLNYLKRLPVDVLKIDQSFVRDLTVDREDAAIVKAILVLAASLGMKTVAEGVETAEQLAFLSMAGCDEIQGFYFSRALPAAELEALLREGRQLLLPSSAVWQI